MQAHPQAIELAPNTLKDIVQQVTRAQTVQLLDWQTHPLSGGREAVSSLYLVEVNARLDNSSQISAFTYVLKVVRMTPERRSADHWNYWCREAEAYQSGTLTKLPSGLSAPRCYGVMTHEDAVWIWLEHIASQQDTKWSDVEIGDVAFDLGRFNGAYLTGTLLPTGTWVSRYWLRQYVNDYAGNIEQLPNLHAHPLAGRSVAPHLLPDLLRLVDEREHLFNRLDGLPQVFAHQDAHRGNLFMTATPANELHLIAVDWSFAGVAVEALPPRAAAWVEFGLHYYDLARQLWGA